MKVILSTEVISENKSGKTSILDIELDDVLVFRLDGKEIFRGDYDGNFKELFAKIDREFNDEVL